MKLALRTNLILAVAGLLLGGCATQTVHERNNMVDPILRVYVVRHAEAYKNVPQPPGTPEEKLDSLTPNGLSQAAAAGRFLADKGVVAVFTSPTGRTRQTADAIAKAIGPQVRYFEDEAFASLKDGTTADGKPTSWSWRKEQLKAGRDPRPVGGESFEDGVVRAVESVNKLAKKYPGKAVVIVSHSDICAGLLGHAAGTSTYKMPQLHSVATASVSEIVITHKGWHLLRQDVRPSPTATERPMSYF